MKPIGPPIARSLLIGMLVLGAGCSGLLTDEPVNRDVLVVNQDNTNHAVIVEIADESGVVYSDGRVIDAETDHRMAQFNQTGEYEVRVTVDGTTTITRHTFESTGKSQQTVNIGIDNQGTVTVS